MPQRNLAVELLRKLLSGEVRTRRRKNVVQARSFAEMLEQSVRKYQNRAIEAAQVIEELIGLAKDMREANARGEALGLNEDELAFYDALETNDSRRAGRWREQGATAVRSEHLGCLMARRHLPADGPQFRPHRPTLVVLRGMLAPRMERAA